MAASEAAAAQSTSNFGMFCQQVKNGAVWTGRQIKVGFTKLAPVLKTIFRHTMEFLRTGFGMTTAGILFGALLITTALTKESFDATKVRIGLVLLGAASIAAGVAMGILYTTAAVI